MQTNAGPAVKEWQGILTMRWGDIRAILLREDLQGQTVKDRLSLCH